MSRQRLVAAEAGSSPSAVAHQSSGLRGVISKSAFLSWASG